MKELKEYTAAQTALHKAIGIPFNGSGVIMSIVIDLMDYYWFIEDDEMGEFSFCKTINGRFDIGFYTERVIKEDYIMLISQNAHAFTLLQMLDPKKELRYNESKEVFELMED